MLNAWKQAQGGYSLSADGMQPELQFEYTTHCGRCQEFDLSDYAEEEFRVLLRQEAVGDHDWTATRFQDRLNFSLRQLAAETGLAFLDLGVDIRGDVNGRTVLPSEAEGSAVRPSVAADLQG